MNNLIFDQFYISLCILYYCHLFLYLKIMYFIFALIGIVIISSIIQFILKKIIYFYNIMAYLITTKPLILYSLVFHYFFYLHYFYKYYYCLININIIIITLFIRISISNYIFLSAILASLKIKLIILSLQLPLLYNIICYLNFTVSLTCHYTSVATIVI